MPENNEQSTSNEMTETLDPGTTAKLFSDMLNPGQTETDNEEKKAESSEEKPEGEKKDEPVSEYLDEKDFGKKVKVKIDGEDGEVSLEEALKGYQTAQHLTKEGQRIGNERAKLKEERSTIEKLRLDVEELLKESRKGVIQPNKEEESDDPVVKEFVEPHIKPLKEEISKLHKVIESLQTDLQPTKYQRNLQVIDGLLKKEGYEDFMSYVPKIEEFIDNIDSKEEMAIYDTPLGFINLFKTFKLDELKSTKGPNPTPQPKSEKKVVVVETGRGGATNQDDWLARYNKVYKKALEEGTTDAWAEVIRMKEGR